MSQQILLETSTNFGFVSLAENDQVLQTLHSTEPKSHSEKTHKFVEEILHAKGLALSQIDFFACGVGPGSFTGIRVSVNAIKTLSYLLQKPVVEINTLEVLAMNYFLQQPNNFVLVATNAFKNMVYYCLYRRGQDHRPEKVMQEAAVFVKELALPEGALTEKCGLVGDGFEIYKKYLPREVLNFGERPIHEAGLTTSDIMKKSYDFPTPSAAVKLAWMKFQNQETKDWKSILPLYIRASEAEENMRGLKYIPL